MLQMTSLPTPSEEIDPTISVAGETVVPDISGGLYWPAVGVLVVADLHFEKGSSFIKRGLTLPPYDTRATLKQLENLCAKYNPQTVIALGDSFHDRDARDRMNSDDSHRIRRLTETQDWVWIVGNHDPNPPEDLGGKVLEEVALGALTFRHEPLDGPEPGEIAGHLHPCAAIRVKGRRLRRRCFITDGQRMIIPAFGAYTGGLNVLEEAYSTLFSGAPRAWMVGRDRVYPMSYDKLIPDVMSSEHNGLHQRANER